MDFGIEFEHHFFGSGHGKNVCDGIGGNVKRIAREYSLREGKKLILNGRQLYDFCRTSNSFDRITFMWIDVDMIDAVKTNFKLEERYARCSTIAGTQKMHKVVPLKETFGVCMFETLADQESTIRRAFDSNALVT